MKAKPSPPDVPGLGDKIEALAVLQGVAYDRLATHGSTAPWRLRSRPPSHRRRAHPLGATPTTQRNPHTMRSNE
jgi:hypothetical protein